MQKSASTTCTIRKRGVSQKKGGGGRGGGAAGRRWGGGKSTNLRQLCKYLMAVCAWRTTALAAQEYGMSSLACMSMCRQDGMQARHNAHGNTGTALLWLSCAACIATQVLHYCVRHLLLDSENTTCHFLKLPVVAGTPAVCCLLKGAHTQVGS